MNIKEAIAALQHLFPRQSVNVSVKLWSHHYRGKRCEELNPDWNVYVAALAASEVGGPLEMLTFCSDGATLGTLIEMAGQHVSRSKEPKETLDGARESLEGL